MVATTAVAATTVEATSSAVEAATTTVEPTSTTTAVEPTAASASVTAAVLGKGGHRANECERSETCEKSLEQGRFPHINNLYRTAVLLPREGKPPLTNRTSNWSLVPSRKLPNGERNQACRHTPSPYRVALAVRAGMGLEPGRSHQMNPPASTRPMAIN